MASTRTAPKGKKRPPFSWTQPCCPECWVGLTLKTGRAQSDNSTAFCCFCRREIGRVETVYQLRVNPGTVPYPTVRKDEGEG